MLLLGLIGLVLLGVFATPFHVIQLEKSGSSPEMNRAIHREIDAAFGESALSMAENLLQAMQARTSDPARKAEFERALSEIDSARQELRDAGREVGDAVKEAVRDAQKSAKEAVQEAGDAAKAAVRDAQQAAREEVRAAKEAVRDARRALADARREAARAKRGTGEADNGEIKSLEEDLKTALQAEKEARRALSEANSHARKGISINFGTSKDKSQRDAAAPAADGTLHIVESDPLTLRIEPLAPELREDIRDKVTRDFYRIGIGAGLILLFIPLFIMAIIAKIFIDRSRASQRMADLKNKEAEYHSMSRQVTEARLQALQAQVEPHFLYNTLASVQALTESDPKSANLMVGHLIEYLRSALPKMRETSSTVGQEVELVRAYLNILKMRMGERLEFSIEVPAELNSAVFPPLMLPSLVENAIKHGLEPLREGGRIDIVATSEGKAMKLCVRDNGKGLGGDGNGAGGVGLVNIRERLNALYGDRGKLTIEENQPRGVVSVIEIPLDAPAPAQAATSVNSSTLQAAPPAVQRTLGSRIWGAIASVHGVFTRVLSVTFLSIIIVLAVLLGIALVATFTGWLPVQVSGMQLDGMEGAAIGSAALVATFAILSLAALLVVAVFYGLGVLLAALAIFIPLVILIALAPALAPVILIGLVIYWLVRKKK